MGLIKKAKRNTADIARIGQMVETVNNLKALGLLSINEDTPDAYIYPEIWAGKDDDFKTNWCKNVFSVWCLTNGQLPEVTDVLTFAVLHKEEGYLLATYSRKQGFRGQ